MHQPNPSSNQTRARTRTRTDEPQPTDEPQSFLKPNPSPNPNPIHNPVQVRARIIEVLKHEPNVSVVPANVKPGAKYSPHDEYLQQMLRAKFCFAPRGDTASAKRLYESIAAGCIPIIISDKLRLPYHRQIDWRSFSLRYTEAEVAADPHKVLSASLIAC